MKRKVIKHGPSTLIVSIPSGWAKKNNVVKGSEVDVVEDGTRLIVGTGDPVEGKPLEVDIDVTGLDKTSLMFTIRSLYRLGYDTVNIKFGNDTLTHYRTGKKLSVISVVHIEVNRLIGFEVIQEKGNSCIIKDLEAASMRDFDQVERRIFLLLLDAISQLTEAAKMRNDTLLEAMEERHDTITKFISYCLRLLNKRGHHIPMQTSYHYYIMATLDRITDIIKYAARDLLKNKDKLHPNITDLLEQVSTHLRLYYEIFYKYEKQKVVDLSMSRYALQEKVRKLPDSIKTTERVIASNIASIPEIVLDLVEARTGLEYSPQPKMSSSL